MQNVTKSELFNDRKVTIFFRNYFGSVSAIKAKLNEVRFGKWAQYENALEVVYKLPRKQKYSVLRQTDDKFVVIVDGWNVPRIDDGFEKTVMADGNVARVSKYLAFDSRYLEDFNKDFPNIVPNEQVVLDYRG